MSVAANSTSPPERPAETPAPPRVGPLVAFHHPFFGMFGDMYFRMSEHSRTPVLVLRQGELDLVLSFPGMRREFAIKDGSHDAMMLSLVAEALDYVTALRPGDPLPQEVLTGEPSWQTDEDARHRAEHRLTAQLVAWLDGHRPGTAASAAPSDGSVRAALREAAERLGLADGEQEVVRRIERLAEELAYIEALRGMFEDIEEIQQECAEIVRMHPREISMRELAVPVTRLLGKAVEEFGAMFRDIDAHTEEILTSLRDLDANVAAIRSQRNQLYRRMRAWQELIDLWTPQTETDSGSVAELLRTTYRFLAPRYMDLDEWVLSTKAPPSAPAPAAPAAPISRRARRRRLGRAMRW